MSRFTDQLKIEWYRTWRDIGDLILGKSPEYVFVGRAKVISCLGCKLHVSKENPVYPTRDIVKCMETAKIVYVPEKIPRWCPYANK